MDRSANLRRLADDEFDLLVIGGGITGAGVALDAVFRGLSVALVERDDFASGTSSRSSKLIHGGLRYLQRLHLGQVRQGLRERRVLEVMAPHLVERTPFLFPRFGARHPLVRAGLTLYDVLAAGTGYPRHHLLPSALVAEESPALRETNGAFEYFDARTDDARLVWTIVRTALEKGAAVANHAEVVGLSGSVAAVRDGLDGATFDVRAKAIVNATGVWVDAIRTMDEPGAARDVRPSKGIHVVVPSSRVPTKSALILPTPDGRFLFVIPWVNDAVLIGTTDADYEGSLDEVGAHPDEIAWVLDVVNGALLSPLSEADVISSFAGLRPLVAHGGLTKNLSRQPLIDVSASGLVTATGGKLTAWRPMAVAAVDRVLGVLDRKASSRTEDVRLVGAASYEGVVPALEVVLDDLGLDRSQAPRLYRRYGALSSQVLRPAREDASLGERLHPALPYLRAEAEYAIRSEGARTVDDVLARRLRASLTSRDGGASAADYIRGRLILAD
jgi:glycerol-3-phosphate dehydrogenase